MDLLYRAILITAVSAALLTTAGACWQQVATRRELAQFPPPGKLIDVGGYRLHLNCTGTGSPAVILVSGAGGSSNVWARVQPQLASITRTCSYDRAGFGWSDSRPPEVKTDPIGELAVLLDRAGVRPPLVLAGHSLGGEYARIYAFEHPGDVAGLLLIATGNPDTPDPGDGAAASRMLQAFTLLSRTGALRLIPERAFPGMYREYMTLLRTLGPPGEAEVAFLHHTRHLQAISAEMEDANRLAERNRRARDFGETPLIVLSEKWIFSEHPDKEELRLARMSDDFQTEMAGFSRKRKRYEIDGGHMIPITRPKAVIDAAKEVLALK